MKIKIIINIFTITRLHNLQDNPLREKVLYLIGTFQGGMALVISWRVMFFPVWYEKNEGKINVTT